MRILHLNGHYFAAGGAETYLKNLADSQRRMGHQVELLFASVPPNDRPSGIGFVEPTFGIRSGLRHRRSFLETVHRAHPDVIHCHVVQYSVSPLILSALAKAHAIVYSVHDTLAFCLKEPSPDPDAPGVRLLPSGEPCCHPVGGACLRHGCYRQLLATRGAAGSIKRILEVGWRRDALRGFAKFIVNSQFSREELVRNGFAPNRIHVIAPPLSVPQGWERYPSNELDVPTILYVGYLVPSKGVFVLLDALSRIRHLRWRAELVGDGPARGLLEEKARALGLRERVRFSGQVERERLAHSYGTAAFLVFPTLAPESWGFVALEAMHFGLPVVATAAGATREWLEDGENGLLVSPADAGDLARAMATLLGDTSLMQRLRQGARNSAARLRGNQADFARRVEDVYLLSLAERAHRASR